LVIHIYIIDLTTTHFIIIIGVILTLTTHIGGIIRTIIIVTILITTQGQMVDIILITPHIIKLIEVDIQILQRQ
jgi:hypothetical protein